jgi:hypothetical protein
MPQPEGLTEQREFPNKTRIGLARIDRKHEYSSGSRGRILQKTGTACSVLANRPPGPRTSHRNDYQRTSSRNNPWCAIIAAMSDPLGRRVGLLKSVGNHAMDFQSAVFTDTLQALLPQIQEGDWHSNHLVLPFTLTCAAALEASLNDHLVAFAFSEFGSTDYKRPAEAYLSMGLREARHPCSNAHEGTLRHTRRRSRVRITRTVDATPERLGALEIVLHGWHHMG